MLFLKCTERQICNSKNCFISEPKACPTVPTAQEAATGGAHVQVQPGLEIDILPDSEHCHDPSQGEHDLLTCSAVSCLLSTDH